MKLAIIGCGNMGMAFAKSFIQYDLVKKEDLFLIEKSAERGEALRKEKAGVVVDTIGPRISEVDLIILAVKPQDFATVHAELKPVIRYNQVVLSIMAGVSIQKIQTVLDHPLVVRAMPNTPAMLGMGMTAFAAAKEVDIQNLRRVENLINATGRCVFLEDESLLDAVTAVSGSGPAYFFYLVKAMVEAGKQMGFSESLSSQLVKQTMLGSYHLIQTSDKSLDELIKAVASKGGTTEAALKTFEENNLAESLIAGLHSAQKRSTELSK
ncbi:MULTISPECIES: pyrroline-5-carboxylate reductase [unclassified Siphonobacter]|uniref:pyrroline-5-carboxylate reductase n=1 Tax=unclassified Siphonobacter TaxID=2635712 RepID=UPI000CBE875D|nr:MULTISPECIES: pyrroline-5-carboxylate reductase [unclassified Siphonobacter]MDQ1086682.1 pyrroline-5-carboxylate reductase [Siphonobacter sp. SORGH_AS_1065]PKK36198.1 pyrroline-5-carboxylate reductase [Siphonobacter sp. SORGH_AS_0500]